MVDVAHTEIDGVPVFFCDAPGPTLVGLTFRVGQADERLHLRGITHLIEHLALTDVDAPYEFNGQTGPLTTTFSAQGQAHEAGAFIEQLTRALAGLAYGRLALEAQVLRTEGQARTTPDLHNLALALRFGPNGLGLGAYPELGLEHPVADELDRWRAQHFTKANAALWITGARPAAFDLSALPTGQPLPLPPITDLLPARPHVATATTDAVIVNAVVERTPATIVMSWILERRLHDRLSNREGRAYQVGAALDDWTADTAHLSFHANALPEHALVVQEAMQVELSRLWMDGPTAAEFGAYLEGFERALVDPALAGADVSRAAFDHLVGARNFTTTELRASVRALTPGDITDAATAFAARPLWIVPNTMSPRDRRLSAIPAGSAWSVGGQTVDSTERRDQGGPARTLAFEDNKLSMHTIESNTVVSFNLDDAAAMLMYSDGGRTIWGPDGFTLSVHPSDWQHAQSVMQRIDDGVPDRVEIAVDRPLRAPATAEV